MSETSTPDRRRPRVPLVWFRDPGADPVPCTLLDDRARRGLVRVLLRDGTTATAKAADLALDYYDGPGPGEAADFEPGECVVWYRPVRGSTCNIIPGVVYDSTAGKGFVRLLLDDDSLIVAPAAECALGTIDSLRAWADDDPEADTPLTADQGGAA